MEKVIYLLLSVAGFFLLFRMLNWYFYSRGETPAKIQFITPEQRREEEEKIEKAKSSK